MENSHNSGDGQNLSKLGIGSAAKTKDETSKRSRKIKQFLLTIAGTLAVVLAIDLVTKMPASIGYKSHIARSEYREFKPAPIDASWVISGSPVFQASEFERAPYWGTSSGFWECIGPAKFVWHYSVDEDIYVLEGSAEIEYLGKKLTLHAGDSTRFVSGTTATWVVNDRVKKTFRIQNPGRYIKALRSIFG
jgi:uncharacterized cupin superfamily protein